VRPLRRLPSPAALRFQQVLKTQNLRAANITPLKNRNIKGTRKFRGLQYVAAIPREMFTQSPIRTTVTVAPTSRGSYYLQNCLQIY